MPAILVAHVMFNLAVVVRTVGAVWQHLSPDLEAAAATLGASPWRTFREVTLPLLRPAILAAAAIVFVFTFTSFGVIRVLGDAGTSTIEVEIWRRATQLGDIGTAATLAVRSSLLIGAVVGWTLVAAAPPQPSARAAAAGPPASARAAAASGLVVAITAVATAGRRRRSARRAGRAILRGSAGWSLTAWRTLGDPEVRPGRATSAIDPLGAIVNVAAHGRAGDGARRRRSARSPRWPSPPRRRLGPPARRRADAADRHVGGDDRLRHPHHVRPAARRLAGLAAARPDRPGAGRRARSSCASCCRCCAASTRACTRPPRRSAPRRPERGARSRCPTSAGRSCVAAGLAAAISLGEFGATSFLSRRGDETMPIVIERLLGRTGRGAAGARRTHWPRSSPSPPCSWSSRSTSPAIDRVGRAADDDGGQCSTSVTSRSRFDGGPPVLDGACAAPSPTARWWRCSGRRAAARARCCASSPA